MKAFLAHWQSFPSSAKNGIILLVTAWAWLFFSVYRYFLAGEVPDRVLVAGIMACTIIFKVRSWARVLCILGNVLAILVHIQLAYQFFALGGTQYGMAAIFTIALFSASTFFLSLPQTAAFYKAHTPDPAAALEANEANTDGNGGEPPVASK